MLLSLSYNFNSYKFSKKKNHGTLHSTFNLVALILCTEVFRSYNKDFFELALSVLYRVSYAFFCWGGGIFFYVDTPTLQIMYSSRSKGAFVMKL